jgi:ABC-type multidrug transport system ATPase subunit
VFNTTVEKNYDLVKDIYAQIEPFRKRRAGALSGGMKQMRALSCALIHQPVVLFLDEPTTGVDPVSRKEFWGMLKNLKQKGITILVSTPYMDEAALCDRIALIQNGSFLAIDSPQGIAGQFSEPLWAVQSNRMSQLLADLRANERVKNCFAFGDKHHVTIRNYELGITNDKDWKWMREYLECKGHQDIEIERIQPGIEDCFIKLIDSKFNDSKIQ